LHSKKTKRKKKETAAQNMKQAKHNIIQNSYHVRLFLLFQKNICTTIPLKGKSYVNQKP